LLGTATRFVVHVIPQKSYVCDSYITDKKSLYAGPPVGGCIPSILPPGSATGAGLSGLAISLPRILPYKPRWRQPMCFF